MTREEGVDKRRWKETWSWFGKLVVCFSFWQEINKWYSLFKSEIKVGKMPWEICYWFEECFITKLLHSKLISTSSLSHTDAGMTGGNLSPNNCGPTWTHCDHSQSNLERFANNFHPSYKCRQIGNMLELIWAHLHQWVQLVYDVSLWNRKLWLSRLSTACMLVVSYKSKDEEHLCHFAIKLPS